MRQFYLDIAGDLPAPGDTVALDREESHHLFTVLRGGRQQQLHLVDGRGHRLVAELLGKTGKGGKQAELRITDVAEDRSELASPQLVLACSVVKGRRFEWVLEKAVELGAHAIWPLLTDHGVVEPRDRRRERWLHLLQAALKQSGRAVLPELCEPMTLSEAVEGLDGDCLLFGEIPGPEAGRDDAPVSWTDLLADPPAPPSPRLVLAIGPEGGWTAAEREILRAAGARPVALGPHVLRTETAAVAGLTALQALRQAWQRP